MKSVLISIQPYWVFLIIAKTMGWNISEEKTVEVRKTFPKDENWDEVVKMYCSKDKKSFAKIPKEYQPLMKQFLGKVIGEFVCDRFIKSFLNINDGWFVELGCLTTEEINKYQGDNPILYAWHISNLVIYDKPRELGEFKSASNYARKLRTDFFGKDLCCVNDYRLTRPPQSWCYVESEE